MLTHISIKNYALIESLEIDISNGLSVITGETGTGKSILLGALGLILGNRSDSKVLMDKKNKCIVEGTFALSSYNLKDFFERADLDYEDISILRREINQKGKSRAFINDTPVSLTILKELGEKLVDIHSQHQNLALGNSLFQLALIDSFANITEEVKSYKTIFDNIYLKKKELAGLLEKEKQSSAEKEFLEFVKKELDEANLAINEQDKLEGELEILNHSEEIKTVLFSSSKELQRDENGLLSQLGNIKNNLGKISSFSNSLKNLSNRFESIFIDLSDLMFEIEKAEEDINFQPGRIDEIDERLNIIYSLETKHRVNSVRELISVQEDIQDKLNNIQSLEGRIKKTKSDIDNLQTDVNKRATSISKKRKLVFKNLSDEISSSLKLLGMPNASFVINHFKKDEAGFDGFDKIQFLFNANRGGDLQELSSVASGGEKSRLMLSLKSLISKKSLLPTIIFDEIDTGVSGAVADKVGNILLSLSQSMQVIAISHLPQIAGKGKEHFLVYKENSESETKTKMKKLNSDERIFEIAKLLSGQEVTSASVESAKHLLKN